MSNRRFRNIYLDNRSHFCTASVVEHLPVLASETVCREVLRCWETKRKRYVVNIEGFVIMPDHVHFLVSGGAKNVRKFVQYSLADCSRAVQLHLRRLAIAGDTVALQWMTIIMSRGNGGASGKVWKERFRCVPIDGETAALQKLDYMHLNPVRQGLVTEPGDWMWSSYSHYAGEPCVFAVDDLVP